MVQQKKQFASIDAYISGSLDEGLLHITGKPALGISLVEAEQAIWEELDKLKTVPVSAEELEKVKNRYESEQIFNNINYLNVAETAQRTFVPENCSILYYKAKND